MYVIQELIIDLEVLRTHFRGIMRRCLSVTLREVLSLGSSVEGNEKLL